MPCLLCDRDTAPGEPYCSTECREIDNWMDEPWIPNDEEAERHEAFMRTNGWFDEPAAPRTLSEDDLPRRMAKAALRPSRKAVSA